MAEELRFFLRTALYSAFIGVVYWFLSYEVAGSIMLGAVVLATALVVAVLYLVVRAARGTLRAGTPGPIHGLALAVARIIGFAQPTGAADHDPVGAGLEPIPVGSVWPLIGGAAALMLGFGVVYGPWLLLPGVVVAAVTVWGWITQMDAPRA